jgi:hypothetical protein
MESRLSTEEQTMQTSTLYYPYDGNYIAVPGTIYAQFLGFAPNPCRKYHVSSDIAGAELVAGVVLPYLAGKNVFHKVVQNGHFLAQQTAGDQAGKFITIYMDSTVEQLNPIIRELGSALAKPQMRGDIRPCPHVPRSRRYHHLFMEQPLDDGMFIYGGFVCDPRV